MKTLALDTGTKCGWAVENGPSGVWSHAPGRFDSYGQKFVKFRHNLHACIIAHKITHIIYEEVRKHMGVDAAHSYGGFLAVLQVVALECGVSYESVPVGTIKKHATGKGNAKKPEMIRAANRMYPHINIIDDNEADALCLLNYAIHNTIQ